MTIDLIKYIKNDFSFIVSILTSAALLVLSVVPFYVDGGYHDTQRLLSTIIIAIALTSSVWFAQVSAKTLWLIGSVYTWCIIAVISSPVPIWSMLEFGILFSIVLISVTLIQRLNILQINHLTVVVVVIHGYYVAHNMIEYAFTIVLAGTFEPYALSSGFSNVRFYGQFLVWTVPFLIGILAVKHTLPYRSIVVAILMFDWAFELLALTRAFLLAMLFSLPAVWWFVRVYWWRYTQLVLITAAGGLVIYMLMLYVIPSLLGVDVSLALRFSSGRDMFNSSGRVQLWLDTGQLIISNPWLGVGPMMTALESTSNISAHPHNYILQLLAEWGIPFTLFIFWIVMLGCIRWKKMIEHAPNESVSSALPLTASLAAGAFAGLFDGLLVMPVSLVYMSLMLACCAGLWRSLTPEVRRCKFPKWSVPVLLLPSIFTSIFATVYWPYQSNSNSTEISKSMPGVSRQLLTDRSPRFWITGRIAVAK